MKVDIMHASINYAHANKKNHMIPQTNRTKREKNVKRIAHTHMHMLIFE